MLTWNLSYAHWLLNNCQYLAGVHQITGAFPVKNVLRAIVSTQSAALCQDWRLPTTEEERMSLQKMMEAATQTRFPYQRKKHRIHKIFSNRHYIFLE